MKVLMFGWEFPPHISGGLGTACFGLTSGLMEHGTDVLFVVPRIFGSEDKSRFRFINASEIEIDHGSDYFRDLRQKLQYIQVSSPLVPYISPEIYDEYPVSENYTISDRYTCKEHFDFSGHYGKDLMREVSQYALVASEIASSNDFDVIHAHDWLTYPAGIIARSVSGKPLVIHVHATEFDRSGDNINQDVYEIEKEGMRQADAIIAVSGLTKNLLVEKYNIPASKISVVHNAVLANDKQASNRTIPKKNKVVTFLGRITFQKGPEYFVAAARKVLNYLPDVRFIMAGSGDKMTAMVREVAKARMGAYFHFTGFLEGDERDMAYARSDVFVMPSVSEPFGIAPLEAIRAGVPAIISKQSGVAEVLNNVIKIDFWDVDAMADAIVALLSYRPLASTFIREGRKEIERLQWSKAASQINNIYHTLIHK